MVDPKQTTDCKHELAYDLLLTLLEHQFSSPVQWISTQDSLLKEDPAGRFIEIGPADTLRSMLEKTFLQSEAIGEKNAEFLTFMEEITRLHKVPDMVLEEPTPPSQDIGVSEAEPLGLLKAEEPIIPAVETKTEVSVVTARQISEIDDAPPLASDALIAIVASALKVSRASIDTANSVKLLARGRSALQNEIVGNLVSEFEHLPDAVEEIPLAELSQDLQRSFSGKLGLYLNEWLSKKISAKLAPGFTLSKLRNHLRDSFGLKEGHQNSFFLTADFDEITTRLPDEGKSWEAVSRWANLYMKERGLEHALTQAVTDDRSQPTMQQNTTSPQLAKFGQELAHLMAKHFKAPVSGTETELKLEQRQEDERAIGDRMDQLSKELGSEFISGVEPYFCPELVYRYQSSWNWAVQDLYVTLSKIITRSTLTEGEEELQEWIEEASDRLQSRSTNRLQQCAKYLHDKWEQQPQTPQRDGCLLLLRPLVKNIKSPPSDSGSVRRDESSVKKACSNSRLSSDSSHSCSSLGGKGSFTPSDSLLSIMHSPIRVCIKDQNGAWKTDIDLTNHLHEVEISSHSKPMIGTVLIIGAGKQSIGFVLVKQLLRAGSRVALCTTRLTPITRRLYSKLYAEEARPGAELVLLPFNQGSVQDITNLVNYIHSDMGWEVDHLVPFAAISEIGKTLEDLDSKSELAHRIMLTNTLRLIGAIVSSKRDRHVLNHSTQVLLPLSPNHGQIGGDGLYAESKLGLEALLNKWSSEQWSDAVSLCGVQIGWTRGTGLMEANDILADDIEKLGARTFSADEMASLLALVMEPSLFEACSVQPFLCDFSGGLQTMPELKAHMDSARLKIQTNAAIQLRLLKENLYDQIGSETDSQLNKPPAPQQPRARPRNEYPELSERYNDQVSHDTHRLEGLVDLDSMVVITGFAEIGPMGSSRTRWEMEAEGVFSMEGCIELAWMTGLIKYERHRVYNGRDLGAGWIECESGEPISDLEVKSKLEDKIRQHTGIRILEPDDHSNPNPRLRDILHEVGTEEDLPPFECSSQAAEGFKARHGDAVEILQDDGTTATVKIRRGASIFIPKALNTEYFVGAQIPTGWDPARYGIPPEILAQADRPSLFALVCTAEAFLGAGITDVYELYKYIHVSEVGNCISSGSGGLTAFQALHEHRLLGREVQQDILSEIFIGTAGAWVNLLLLSASGPLKTAAGTCASSLESVDTACELISSGRSKACIAGGYEVFTRPIYYEFGNMSAIINSSQDSKRGREPSEMSRPFTSTRNGFVLSEGIGIQVLTSASLALEMGLPIYGVIAMTHMAADKIGRSIPAPGQGILTAAKQTGAPSLLMNPTLRAKRIRTSLGHIERQAQADMDAFQEEISFMESRGEPLSTEEIEARVQGLEDDVAFEKKTVLRELGNNFWRNKPNISPIAGGLSVFGLSVDDITFVSMHGTATKLNDMNECATLEAQMRHLGRHPANPMYTIAQKSVVGHGLGASGAWALNGALQALHSGIIPGNRNADDIDPGLQKFERLLLVNENIKLHQSDMKAFCVESFGFGQKSAQVLVVHPRYLYSAISEESYQQYRKKQMGRARIAARELDRGLHGQGMFKAKEVAPFVGDEHAFLLNPLART
ncbi:Acyl transferase/acyl hydrolase/lysophospholipase [Penicillium vulpinum]|uniref:Ketosynthase family 3 (KS3) domain-containing protein n=1 Tax=Penicillium vulpinum TaxID=29845 RepID=A0A1V6R419_9EURO|nr:Acyl transferase/acyl hydrolase/lysophospholipase [Penicillium vulpinum]KAJ5951042.1 Acyl transferase/acyl hydrolase/lysophospholipase [Penicillium vulpinum]OQD96195.1 hypothetical protein PENVUL_c097G08833 [Penicillium vulpinum]